MLEERLDVARATLSNAFINGCLAAARHDALRTSSPQGSAERSRLLSIKLLDDSRDLLT